jgi:hypothetical protein
MRQGVEWRQDKWSVWLSVVSPQHRGATCLSATRLSDLVHLHALVQRCLKIIDKDRNYTFRLETTASDITFTFV